MAGVKGYSTTAATNTALFPENMAPSAVNNNLRQVQADLAEFYREDGWRELGDGTGSGTGGTDYTATFASATSATFTAVDVTGDYHAGRRVRANVDGGSFIYGLVTNSTFSTNTTVTFAWVSGSLTSGAIRLWLGEHPATNKSIGVESVQETKQTPVSASGTLAFKVTSGSVVQTTLIENVSTVTVTWPAGVSSYTLIVKQDATGARTFAFPAGWKWSNGAVPTVSAGANAIDIFTVFSDDGGTTVYAFQAGVGMS